MLIAIPVPIIWSFAAILFCRIKIADKTYPTPKAAACHAQASRLLNISSFLAIFATREP